MKTNTLRTLLLSLTLLSFLPSRALPAEAAPLGLELITATDGESMLRRTELKVALKQYEKVLTDLYAVRIEVALGPTEDKPTVEQRDLWKEQVIRKREALLNMADELRTVVRTLTKEAAEKAKAAGEGARAR